MAPVRESTYFPPLDRCLDGRVYLSSWSTTYIALTELQYGPGHESLQQHLTDAQTLDILKSCFDPYPPANLQSKSSFETKTSAINVAPSAHTRYNIKEIQDDALWLSKEANINEVAALRMAVLEWQTRPAAKLSGGESDSSPATSNNLQPTSKLQASFVSSRSAFSLSSKNEATVPIYSPSWRRNRLLEIYISERRFIFKTCEWLICSALYENNDDDGRSAPIPRIDHVPKWVAEAGRTILSSWNIHGISQTGKENVLVTCIDSLRLRVEDLGKGKIWLDDEEMQAAIESKWLVNRTEEIISIMRIMLDLSNSSAEASRSDVMLSWFALMKECAFFENLELPFQEGYDAQSLQVQSLASLISLTLLDAPRALDMLSSLSTAASSTEDTSDDAAYLVNPTAFNEINETLLAAADLCLKIASPACLAWSVILQSVREHATLLRETRETRQSVRALDRFNTVESSESESVERSGLQSSGSSARRRSSFGSDTSQQSSFLEDMLEKVMLSPVEGDPITFLAKSAVDGSGVLGVISFLASNFCTPFGTDHLGKSGLRMRCVLLDLLRVVLGLIEYQPDLILATLAVLTGSGSFWDMQEKPLELMGNEPAAVFLQDTEFMQKLFQEALSRFPYEISPFLTMCRALASCGSVQDREAMPAIWHKLENVDSFTCLLPQSFTGYELLREDEESSLIQLTADLNIIRRSQASHFNSLRSKKLSHSTALSNSLLDIDRISAGTIGRVLSDSKPLVVLWRHDYSPIAYLGHLLELASSGDMNETMTSTGVTSEIIGLFAVILLSGAKTLASSTAKARSEMGEKVLNKAGEGLEAGQDIVSVVFDIFEQELNKRLNGAQDDSLDVLVQCIQFTFALLKISPDRVWPFLGRSSLLGIKNRDSQLSAVVFTAEVPLARYDFLYGCVRVFDALISDAISNAIVRQTPAKALGRFSESNGMGLGVSQTVMNKVLLSFHRIMVDLYESCLTWNFADSNQQMQIRSQLCLTFQNTLSYFFGVDDEPDPSLKLTGSLAASAEHITRVFLSSSNNELALSPLFDMIARSFTEKEIVVSNFRRRISETEVCAALDFANTLLRVNLLLGYQRSYLERRILETAPVLANVYSIGFRFRKFVIQLFTTLILCADITEKQPPSLLGHLGEESAVCMLEILSMIDQPLKDQELSILIWKLFSAIVSRRQQWLAVLILTGDTPRGAVRKNKNSETDGTMQNKSILIAALDYSSNLGRLPPAIGSAILEFVALATDSWPWVFATVEEHPHFLTAISDYITQMETASNTSHNRSRNADIEYQKIQIASYIVDILATYVYYTRQSNNNTFVKSLLSSLAYVSSTAVSPPTYNNSLHSNLRRNIEDKFAGCRLRQFKRTGFQQSQLGDSFYYDLAMAGKLLASNPSWKGRGDNGFFGEVTMANLNLSIVEAQVNLLHSWKALAIELGQSLGADAEFQNTMAEIIIDCLRTNTRNNLPEAIFERLAQTRADLAFTLLQRLVEVGYARAEIKIVLFSVWDAIRAHGEDLSLSFKNSGAAYTRTLLRALCLALQVQVLSYLPLPPATPDRLHQNDAQMTASAAPQSIIPTVLEILKNIVAHGFRALITLLHDSSSLVQPSDFALLSAILRASLRIPGLDRHTTTILSMFADNQTSRCASTLLSWSDQLATGRDPVYGELSINFLVEMSNVPALAENLAVDGILGHISDTNVVKHLIQGKGMGPLDPPVRMYNIWVQGILPLLLNLLHAVGGSMASEIAASLSQFTGMTKRASLAFTFYGKQPSMLGSSNDPEDKGIGYLTLSMVSEAQSLAIITRMLDSYREAGPSAGVVSEEIPEIGWEQIRVKEDVENWLQRRNTLRERIVAIGEREEGWARTKPIREETGAVNRLEEKMVDEMGVLLGLLGVREE